MIFLQVIIFLNSRISTWSFILISVSLMTLTIDDTLILCFPSVLHIWFPLILWTYLKSLPRVFASKFHIWFSSGIFSTDCFFLCVWIISEKAMATHSSTLAWKIPWTEEPGRLQSMGSLRVGHDWETSLSFFTFMHWRRKWQPTPMFLPGESRGWGSLVDCHLWGRTESDTIEAT